MGDIVFDVTYELSRCVSLSVLGVTGLEAAKLRRKHPGALITPRKLLPCAQRLADARIATLPPAGTTPATPAGGGDL